MSVLKFLNPGKRKLSLLSREEIEKLDRKVPGTNTNSNRTVTEAKKRAKTTVKVKEDTRAANRRISKQLADEATERMAAKRERLLKGIQERPVSLQLSDAYASSHGEIKDGNQVALDKAMSWYGLSNGLGLTTNISDRWRATPSFANFVGRSTPEAMAMAGSLVANPVGTILGMGTGHLGSQAGGYIGELLGNREAGEIAGSLVGMPFGYKAGTTLQRTVPNYYRNYTLARAINQGVRETELPITRRTISVNRSENSVQLQPDLVYTLYNEFGEPIGLTNVGGAVFGSGDKSHRMVDGVMSMRNAHKVSEDTYNVAVQDILEGGGKGLESGWSLMSPQKTLAVTKKFPHEVIGLLFGNPVRLLTGTTNRPIPTRVKGNHYQEIKPLYKTVYNETTGDIDWIPIEEKAISTEKLYNHPGAFLGNTVRENGGITVNGERVLRRPYTTPQTVNEGTVAPGLVNDLPIVAGGRNITVNREVINNALPEEFVQRGWEAKKPITVNGKETLLVWHPEYGYTSLEEATGEVGRGNYANLVTNEALDAYNPAIRADASNGTFLDQLRSIARKIDRGKETPADIKNTTEYEYPRIWDLILKTSLGKQEYPNGATMVSRGLWPGSSTTAKSPNYDALFTGYNRDMAMPYVRIGQNLGGKNNFGLPLYEKYFSKEKVELLRNIDRQIEELITTKGYYNQEDSGLLQHLHNLRSTLLGDKLPEFGGLQLLLVPNKANGEMLNTVMPRGLAMEHSTFGDLGAGNPIYISRLAGDTGFYDANAVSGALASEGPANNIYGVWLHSHSPEFTGIHDKGVGSTLIWNLDGFAPFLKSVHGNSIKNLSGSIESAYKKGGKFLKNNK